MKINAPLYSLNAGEVSKIALARVDVAKFRMAAQCQLNWMPYVVGPMMLRPGLLYSGEVLNDSPAKLMRFVFSKLDTVMIELTANQMRVWINEVLLTRPSVGTQILDPYFAGTGVNAGAWSTANTTAGASVTIAKDATDDRGSCVLTCTPVGGLAQVEQTVTVAAADQGKEHGIRFVVTNGPVTVRAGSSLGASDLIAQTVLDTGTHSLTCVPTGPSLCIQIESADQWNKTVTQCSIEAGGTVILPTPWAATDLPNIRYDQSGDVVYVACYGQQQQTIQRRGVRPGARGWSVVLYKTNDGPFNALPTIANVIMTPSVCYGNGTLSASNPFFKPAHVGGLIRLFCSGQNNNCVLGGQGAFSDPVRVDGVIKADRAIAGTISGTLTVQRSFTDATTGFTVNTSNTATFTSNGTFGYDDITSSTSYANVIVWLRIGFANPGDYVSGAATITWAASGPSGTDAASGQGGQYAVCRITGYNSPTSVNVEAITSPESLALGMVTPIPTLNGTANWVEGQWSGVQGWPTSVCFHEGRLCWFGGGQCWLSASDNYTNFADIDFDGTSTGDGGAINITLGSGPLDTVSWGLSLTRLLIGREQSIGSCRSSNFDQPVTPTGIVIRDCSDQGAQRLPAIKVGKRGVFVQQSGRKVYELSFAGQEMDYDDRDLTRLNLDIGLPGFVDIDKSTQPDKMVWLPRGDGQCATLLYDVRDEVDAWWRVQTLGVIENVAVLPGSGTEDTVFFVVRRTINGVTRRFIEKLALRADCIGGVLNKQLDCALVYSGSPVSSVQVPWLPATTLSVWADGTAIGSGTTDASGNLTMPDGLAHSNIVAGLAGSVVTATAASPSTTLPVGIQYNGYPCEAFADVGSTGEPIHVGSLVVSNGTITLPNGQQATTITACLGLCRPLHVGEARLCGAARIRADAEEARRALCTTPIIRASSSGSASMRSTACRSTRPTSRRRRVPFGANMTSQRWKCPASGIPIAAVPARPGPGTVHGRGRGDRDDHERERMRPPKVGPMTKPRKKTCVRLRPAIASDLPNIIGEPLPCRIRAITVLADDRLIGMGGIAYPPHGPVIAFVQQAADAKNYPVAFHRAGLLAMRMIRDAGIMQVIATTDRDNPTAVRWIRRLGFVTSAVQPFEDKLLFEWNRDDAVIPPNERTTADDTGSSRTGA